MYSFFEVLEWHLRGSDGCLSDNNGYSNEFIQKSNAFFDCIKKNKMFRESQLYYFNTFYNLNKIQKKLLEFSSKFIKN